MKEDIKKDWLIWLVLIAPFIYVLASWSTFPDRVPIHYNWEGEPDRYGDKFTGLLLLPLINIGLYFLLLLAPKIDPRKENYAKFAGSYRMIRLIIHLFLGGVFVFSLLQMKNADVNAGRIVQIMLPLLFIFLGNYLTTVRHNYFVGVRTPWTLANEKVWVRTHRFTGKLWVLVSLIPLLLAIFGWLEFYMLMIYVAILVIIPFVYSYREFKKETGGKE